MDSRLTLGDMQSHFNIPSVTIRAWANRGILPELAGGPKWRRLDEREVRLIRLTAGLAQQMPASKAAEIARSLLSDGVKVQRLRLAKGLILEVDVEAFLSNEP